MTRARESDSDIEDERCPSNRSLSNQGRVALLVVGLILVVVFIAFGISATRMMGPFGFGMATPGFFFIFGAMIIVVIVAAIAMSHRAPGIQRPPTPQTAYPPPPPPDSVLVKCPYCGTSQSFGHNCANCGAPLPKPEFG